jgi:hypothetical protein
MIGQHQGSTQGRGIPTAGIDDDVGIALLGQIHLLTQCLAIGVMDAGNRGFHLTAGKGCHQGALPVAIDGQNITAMQLAGNGQVECGGGLADATLGIEDCQNHDGIPPSSWGWFAVVSPLPGFFRRDTDLPKERLQVARTFPGQIRI